MEILTQAEKNNISRVLRIKNIHSKIREKEEANKTFIRFRFAFLRRGKRNKSYINHLYPVFYYEWSKRQTGEYDFNEVYLSLMFVNHNILKTFDFDTIDDTNNTTFKQRFKKLDDTFKKYNFQNMRAHFVLVHPLQLEEWEKGDIKEFLEWEKCTESISENTTISELSEKYEELDKKYLDLLERQENLRNQNHVLCVEANRLNEENRKLSLQLLSKKDVKIQNGFSTFKNEECVICYQNQPNILFCNCGHICICDECEELASSSKCPICREENNIKRKI